MRLLIALVAGFALAGSVGVATAAEGIEPVEGGWKGETRQGLPVYFGVRDGRVINTRYRFHWGFCGTYGSHEKKASLETDPTGHWIIKDSRGSSFEGTFIAPNRVEGMVLVEEREFPGCPKVVAPFVASPRRG
ncbi:MAG TPA: hypothetical protein VII45_13390 [Solirubrobacterales bacterium]